MTVTKLPSGRYRAQVWHDGKWVSVPKVIGGPKSYRTKREAGDAKREAERRLKAEGLSEVTVAQWRDRWLTDPLFRAPSESTNIHRAERTRAFADAHGDKPLRHINDFIVAQWLTGGRHKSTVPCLRKMFNDAATPLAGRLVTTNPFSALGLDKGHGNRRRQPPNEQQAWTLIQHARDLTPPSFAAYLEVACWSAARPGELDALEWGDIDWDNHEIHIDRQWNVKTRTFTLPKHQNPHTVTLTPHARDALLRAREKLTAGHDRWCFTTARGNHYTPSTRNHHWNRVRSAAGLGHVSLYMATRHFAGWYMLNILELPPHVIAEQLGHRDGGKLVVELYGHPDGAISRRKIHEAYSQTGQVRPIRTLREDTA